MTLKRFEASHFSVWPGHQDYSFRYAKTADLVRGLIRDHTKPAGLPMKYKKKRFQAFIFLVSPGLGEGYNFRYAKTADLVRGLIPNHTKRRFAPEICNCRHGCAHPKADVLTLGPHCTDWSTRGCFSYWRSLYYLGSILGLLISESSKADVLTLGPHCTDWSTQPLLLIYWRPLFWVLL